MAPFIPRLSDHTANLRELLKKYAEYEWSSSHQKSLQDIKDIICKEMLLCYYDPSKKSTIQVDASSRGLGAALIQEGKPIAFASKSLIETKQRKPILNGSSWQSYLAVNVFERIFTIVHLKSKVTTNPWEWSVSRI